MFARSAKSAAAVLAAMAMVCATAVFGSTMASAQDASGVTVPDYCGDNSVVMLTDSGEVYQIYIPQTQLPATGDITTNGGRISAECMVPLPYLPANITLRAGISPTDPDRFTRRPDVMTGSTGTQRTYDALASNRDDGTLWAALTTGTAAKPEMQLYKLTKEAREEHASHPNPAYTATGISSSYWTPVGGAIASAELGGAFPTGGAVDKSDGTYYVSAVKPSQCYINRTNTRVFSDCSKYSATTRAFKNWDIDFWKTSGGRPVKAGSLSLTTGDYAPSGKSSDIEFDDQGNMTLILSWYEAGRAYTRHVRRVHIPAAHIRDGSFIPDSDGPVDTNASLPIRRGNAGLMDLNISGIGASAPSSGSLVASLFNSYGLPGQSLYSFAEDGTLKGIFTFPSNPPHTTERDQEGRNNVQRLVNPDLWGGGSTLRQTFPHSYTFYSGDITDIADGFGLPEPPQPYYGSYQFKKVDESGNPLAGARFTLWPRGEDGVCAVVPTGSADAIGLDAEGNVTGKAVAVSGADGAVRFPHLPLGQAKANDAKAPAWFCVAETQAPANYMAHAPWAVDVRPDMVTSGEDVVNQRATGMITVVKHDETTARVLAGAQFALVEDTNGNGSADAGEPELRSGGQTVQTTPEDGTVVWTDVPLGKAYVIHEVKAPEGYLTAPEETPARREQGITLTTANRSATVHINDIRKTGRLSWGKYAAGAVPMSLTAHNALRGSEWTLTYTPDAGNPSQGWTRTVTDCTQAGCRNTGTLLDTNPAAGLFTVEGLEWGTYVLKETKAPLGYVLSDRTYTFDIGSSNLEPAAVLIPNTQVSGPRLPAAGGTSEDLYKWIASGLFGCALLVGIVALIRKRRTPHL